MSKSYPISHQSILQGKMFLMIPRCRKKILSHNFNTIHVKTRLSSTSSRKKSIGYTSKPYVSKSCPISHQFMESQTVLMIAICRKKSFSTNHTTIHCENEIYVSFTVDGVPWSPFCTRYFALTCTAASFSGVPKQDKKNTSFKGYEKSMPRNM